MLTLLSRADLAKGNVRRIAVTKFADPAFVLAETSPSAVAVYASHRAAGESAADSFLAAFSDFFLSEEGCFSIGFSDAAWYYACGLRGLNQTPESAPSAQAEQDATPPAQTAPTLDPFATPV